MHPIRTELKRGLALFILFLALILASSTLFPYAIKQSEYAVVSIDRLKENPVPFEGENISSEVTITSILENGTYLFTERGVTVILIIPSSLGSLEVGDQVNIRGTSWILTNNTIIVHELYVRDYNSSPIRSVPGIILFAILFFSVFRIDLSRLAFVRRKL